MSRLRLSLARWCFVNVPLDALCTFMRLHGITGVDLAAQAEWSTFRAHGIHPCLVHGPGGFQPAAPDRGLRYGPAIGWSDAAQHAALLQELETRAAAARHCGVDHLVSLFGNRDARSAAENLANCIAGLRAALPILERHKVKLSLEVLNSRIDHPDYFADSMAVAASVCEAVASPRVGMLCDLYHLQVMGEDPLLAIRTHMPHIGHMHLGAAPGRRAPGPGQDVDWHAILSTLAEYGYAGYLGHEWLPQSAEPLAELAASLHYLDAAR